MKKDLEETIEENSARKDYLTKFKRENEPSAFYFQGDVNAVGEKIVELMKKEDLTRDQANDSLQYAYNLIKYQSNFLKLN